MAKAIVYRRLPRALLATLDAFPQLFVAGGFMRAVVGVEPVNDIDVFTTDLSIVDRAVRFYTHECCHNVTKLKTPCTITVTHEGLPVQFINNAEYMSPRHCLNMVDFTICQAACWQENSDIRTLCTPEFLRDVAAKQLVYASPVREEAPGGSLWRAFKFARRGYNITQLELAKLVYRMVQGLPAAAIPPVSPGEETDRIRRSFSHGSLYSPAD